MAKKGKRYQEAAALIEKGKAYPIEEAVALVKMCIRDRYL